VKKVYIDTSAFFKLFVEEEASDVVERIIDLGKLNTIQVILSDWVINESLAIVDEYRRKAKIDKLETQKILSELVDMIEDRVKYASFIFYAITEKVVISSRFMIQDLHIPASDALHVFIATSADCDCIVSADKNLVTQVRDNAERLLAFNIREPNDVAKLFELLPK
jgi:predicted nucleic acid-binding protein